MAHRLARPAFQKIVDWDRRSSAKQTIACRIDPATILTDAARHQRQRTVGAQQLCLDQRAALGPALGRRHPIRQRRIAADYVVRDQRIEPPLERLLALKNRVGGGRSEGHTSELQSPAYLA